MINYDMRGEFNEQRGHYLGYLLFITAFVGTLVFALNAITSNINLAMCGCFAATIVISNVLRRRQITSVAAWVFLVGITATFAIDMIQTGASTPLYLAMLVPVAASTLVVDHENTLWFTGLVSLTMYLITASQMDWHSAVAPVLPPVVLGFIVSAILNIKEANALELVVASTDVQTKANKRADMYYEQKEQLGDTLLQLTHAKSRLELLNVKLGEAQRKTEEASRAKSVFLSNMSHELRTPLNVIIGYSSTMLDMPAMYSDITLPDNYRADVQLVKDNGYYLLGLINDILDLSKIEAGKLDLHCTVVDLPEIFRGIMATSIGLVKEKPVQVRPDFPDIMPKVWADPMRLRQIILNLMSNAIKFTPTGSVTLQGKVEGDTVIISVIDTGIGIPEKALAQIFDRFEQAERDTDKTYGGTGLGLDISKQLAQMHGSTLNVQSTVGQGSAFSFTLAFATESQMISLDALENLDASQSVRELVPDNSGLAATVLLVEDESSLREMLRRTLESVGHVVVDIQDGAEVMDMAVGLLPELIILDVRLPNMNGWEVLEALKKNPETATIPVIICTVNEDEERAMELGAQMYIRKPFSSDEVLTCVQELLAPSVETDKGLS